MCLGNPYCKFQGKIPGQGAGRRSRHPIQTCPHRSLTKRGPGTGFQIISIGGLLKMRGTQNNQNKSSIMDNPKTTWMICGYPYFGNSQIMSKMVKK